jgi:hypothetical protein
VTVEPPPSLAAQPRSATLNTGGRGRGVLVSLASIALIALVVVGLIGALYLAVANSDIVEGDDGACQANLVAIGRAMLLYHSEHGRFPPAVVFDSQGRPMHSWRVLLLPYLGQDELFSQYNMGVPWDDPRNQMLGGQMPAVYHCHHSLNVAGSETSYMVVTGSGTIFAGRESASQLEILDGTANTLLVAETTGMAINWLEPRDLALDSLALTVNSSTGVGIGSQHPKSKTHVLMADGSIKTLDNLTSPETLEAMLTIDGADTPAN